MKLLYLGAFRFPNGDAASARVINNARALRDCGHEVEFLAWGGRKREEDLCVDGLYRYDGFVYSITNEIDCKGNLFKRAISYVTAGRKTKQILINQPDKYDVIIFYNGRLWLTNFLLHFANNTGVKLVHDLTEWYSKEEIYPLFRLQYYYNMQYLQRKVLNKICISSFLDIFYKESHNIVVPALCDVSESKWDNQSRDLLPQNILSFNGVRFIYAGTPSRKDLLYEEINVLNKLIKQGYKFQLLVLGCSRDNFLKENGDLLTDKKLDDNIVFLGRVSQTIVPAYYHISDFMILLRQQNRKNNAGFPTKFTESLVSGTPVIANLTSDINRYLIDGKNGFIVSDCSAQKLVDVLIKVSHLNRDAINSMKRAAKLMAVQNFDYHSYQNALKEYFSSLE